MFGVGDLHESQVDLEDQNFHIVSQIQTSATHHVSDIVLMLSDKMPRVFKQPRNAD